MRRFIYRSYEDLADCIRRNLWKIPSDTDLIVGVPRSGMIPALMVAELLNKRYADLDTFLRGAETSFGKRGGMMRRGTEGKVLVIDDASRSGLSVADVKERLASVSPRYDITYCCVYVEADSAKNAVDVWMEDLSHGDDTMVVKEWNILHLFRRSMKRTMWDIDGLMCKDPPDDRDGEAYEAYISDALPMVVPTSRVGAIVTYRLEKYRHVTEQWLESNGIRYGGLVMFDAASRDERNAKEGSASYKARVYGGADWADMFIESDRKQAERIFNMTGKPVFCYANGRMYI